MNHYPDLAEELEEEMKKMKAEVEAHQVEVKSLQDQLFETGNPVADASSATIDGVFVPPTHNEIEKAEDNVVVSNGKIDG